MGDTLWSLARRFGTTVEELVRLNNIADPDLIYAGAPLRVPGAPLQYIEEQIWGEPPPGEPPPEEPPPTEPPPAEEPEEAVASWWGAEVFGEQGWVYLPTTPGEQPTQWQTPEGEEPTSAPVGPGWYNLRGVQYFNQLPPTWRNWLGEVMQAQQEYWESPTIAPIQWMPSTAAYQRAPLYMWEPLAGGTPGGQHAIQPPGWPYAPPPEGAAPVWPPAPGYEPPEPPPGEAWL